MLLLGRLITHMAPRQRGGKSISVSGDRGDNAITKKRKKEKKKTDQGNTLDEPKAKDNRNSILWKI